MKNSVEKSRKKLIAAGIIAAAALLIFLGYPLLFCAINYPGIVKEKDRVMELLGEKGFEVYSGKAFSFAEMEYRGGYLISYITDYVIVFKSDRDINEIYDELPFLLVNPLGKRWDMNPRAELADKVKQPENKEGYYAAWFPCNSTVNETSGTVLHTLFYADEKNREEMKRELGYYK